MDIVLIGEIDGIEAAEQIRSRYDIPVIYVTAYADEEILKRAKLTEPFGYIIKPFEDRELRGAIEMALYKHHTERKLRESEEWLSTTLKSIGDAVIATDRNGLVTFMNPVAEELTGWQQQEAIGEPIEEIFHIINEKNRKRIDNPLDRVLQDGMTVHLDEDTVLIARDGGEKNAAINSSPIRDVEDTIIGMVLVCRDITEMRKVEKALIESESKLRIHSEELKESNTALKVLLKQRENDKHELEANILSNVKKLILPYVENLKRNRSMSQELAYLNIIESNLNEIVSPFSLRLSSTFLGFTPKEIQISNLVKDGKQDKDMSEILNISLETVKSHRQNIRKKLGIYKKRVNLRTYLLSLTE
jgi:PAS domain S-box-containing protein